MAPQSVFINIFSLIQALAHFFSFVISFLESFLTVQEKFNWGLESLINARSKVMNN